MCVFSFGHKACRIQLPDQGLKLHPLHWKAASYPLDPKEVLGILFHSQLSLRAYFQRQATPSYLIVLFFLRKWKTKLIFLHAWCRLSLGKTCGSVLDAQHG